MVAIVPRLSSLKRNSGRTAAARLASLPREQLWQSANSYFGLVRQATHPHADLATLANVLRRRGKAVRADLAKAYR